MNAAELATMKVLVAQGWPREVFSDALFDVWAEHLTKYPAETVYQAVKLAIATERFRPPVVEIAERLYDGPDGAAVARMAWQAIARYGYHSEERARNELPSVVWDAIEAFGGWTALCCSPDDVATRERIAKSADVITRRAARGGFSLDRADLGVLAGTNVGVADVARALAQRMKELDR